MLLQYFEVSAARWIYDTVEDRLILEDDGDRQEVSLSPQQHRLVAHMAARNRHEGGRAVLCQREELIAAIWADEPDHSPQDVAYVVHQLRTRIDGQLNAPELILNERGRGYRLLASCRAPAVGGTSGASASATRRRLIVAGAGMLAALGTGGLLAFAATTRSSQPILREGSRGQDVVALQRDLQQLGYDPVYVDGQYGPLTAGAVRAFQQDSGLVVDGEVGPETRRAIQDALARRSS